MVRLMAVDLQYDFTRPKGQHFKPERTSVNFVRKEIIPFLVEKEIKIAEIISDYRQPRPGDLDDSCRPGEWGYTSEIPDDLVETRWIKCLNSPLYTRKNIGVEKRKPGKPEADAEGFYSWLNGCIRRDYHNMGTFILFGLTLDCCVLCTAQAIRFHGYDVKIVMEGTDTYDGFPLNKTVVMNRVLRNWAEPVTWAEAQGMLTAKGI